MAETWTTRARRLKRFGRRLTRRCSLLTRRVAQSSPVRLNAKPDFLVIGAQKAGTTSLWVWLSKHPDVVPARGKELHFFDRASEPVPIEKYWARFPFRAKLAVLRWVRRRRVVTGEATPIYLFDPRVPAMIKRHVPDAKIIILLRDPVDRAISHYWMEVKKGKEPLSLEDALATEDARIRDEMARAHTGAPFGDAARQWSYVSRGLYDLQLERWLDAFGTDRLLVLDFDDLASRPFDTYTRTLDFLGLDPSVDTSPELQPQHIGSRRPTRPETIAWLRSQFAESNARVREMVTPAPGFTDADQAD